jgi:hypothetical protein
MRRLYRIILKVYPAEYRNAFGAEMIGVFDQARADARKRGALRFVLFMISEFSGLLKGLLREFAAKWASGEAYVTFRSTSRQLSEIPAEVIEVERHLEHVLRSMEFAIAHHDFPKARFYSNEEYAARARLERLRGEYS